MARVSAVVSELPIRMTKAKFMEWVRSCIAASEPGIDLPDFERLWKIFG